MTSRRSSKAVVSAPAVALIFHQEDEAAAVNWVAEAGLWVFVLATPPGDR